uniref:Uncharacterized protein n=1 Tax=Anguilla anguilla TaxID=7936 RepID=A0A0E9SH49_ANGAN
MNVQCHYMCLLSQVNCTKKDGFK